MVTIAPDLIDEALAVPGWMDQGELEWLGQKAAECESVFEVGCWQGRTTKVLAATCPGTVYAVDNLVGESGTPIEDLEQCLRENLSRELRSGKVMLVIGPSVETAFSLEPGFADMVFLDGDHVHPAPWDDITAWWEVVRPGGLLCGHDGWMEGVEQALKSIDHDWKFDPPGSIWYAVK